MLGGEPVPLISGSLDGFVIAVYDGLNFFSSYCRELISELSGLDRMLRNGSTDFIPTHVRRLIEQEIQRIESCLNCDESQRYIRPLREVLRNAPLIETIGQPPLRVPPSLLRRQMLQATSSDGLVGFKFMKLKFDSFQTANSISSPTNAGDSSTVKQDDDSKDFNYDELDKLSIATAEEPDETDLEKVEKKPVKFNPQAPVYIPRCIREAISNGTASQSTPTRKSDGRSRRQRAPTGNKSWRQPSAKQLPPIMEAPAPMPLRVVYLDGMPEDVEIIRQQQTGGDVWMVILDWLL
jgi:hypothetical protein